MQKKVFQLIVDNTSGVLSRISGLYSRRGYNIESLSVATTIDPKFSRITVVTVGYPDEAPNPRPRKAFEDVAVYNKF